MANAERYIAPVGFAREPIKERRRWIGRFFLAILVVFIAWLLYTRVVNPPSDEPTPRTTTECSGPGQNCTLPGPG